MYTVTFYSFKGGVGRTMSLVNIASLLAQSGKKVLVVDFDLEAPGIPTFDVFHADGERKGLVDYIVDYKNTTKSPDVRNYIFPAKKYDGGGELHVMPAGYDNSEYSAKLNSIDWVNLYNKEDGYIFFEDMRQQWEDFLKPDYVLIDSRTGHSDVEGICTRQLPDAVCFLFFPNEQNLDGLKRVVNNVHKENERRSHSTMKPPMALHFVVSNVPDLDDEDGIIGRTLNKFRDVLQYKDLAGQIHHYDSLSLLNQEIFSESRPNSRLTREYKIVKDAIVRENLSDRDAALAFVKQATQELFLSKARERYSLNLEKIETIQNNFPNDSEISLHVAIAYEAIGRTNDALNILVTNNGHESAHFYAIRARMHHRVGHREEAIRDLEIMLQSDGAEATSLLGALSIVPQVKPELFSLLATSKALLSLEHSQRLFVALQIEDGELELLAKASILESVFDAGNTLISHQLVLASIGLGRFERAIELLDSGESRSLDIGDSFNLAMAKFGLSGEVDSALLARVVEFDKGSAKNVKNANYAFCLAIANSAIGNIEDAKELINISRVQIKLRGKRDFSPWSYTRVPAAEFLDHLNTLEHQMARKILHPDFINVHEDKDLL